MDGVPTIHYARNGTARGVRHTNFQKLPFMHDAEKVWWEPEVHNAASLVDVRSHCGSNDLT